MSKKLTFACAMICAGFVAGITSAQTKGVKPAPEPRAFYEEGDPNPFTHPVPLPGSVLDALRATDEARDMRDRLKDYDRDDFAALFKAVKIHLAGPNELDYVVMGEFPMGGADAPWFWIVRFDKTHSQVIFFTFANGFEILKTSNNGYPDIRSNAFTASTRYTEIYQYNGEKYVLVHRYHKENTP